MYTAMYMPVKSEEKSNVCMRGNGVTHHRSGCKMIVVADESGRHKARRLGWAGWATLISALAGAIVFGVIVTLAGCPWRWSSTKRHLFTCISKLIKLSVLPWYYRHVFIKTGWIKNEMVPGKQHLILGFVKEGLGDFFSFFFCVRNVCLSLF